MPRPLVVTPAQVRRELSGPEMGIYLQALADPFLLMQCPVDEDAVSQSIDESLEEHIREAQAWVEMETHIILTHTRFVTRPAAPELVRGADFDRLDDAYPLDRAEWARGTGRVRLRWRPLVELHSVEVGWGQGSQPAIIRKFDPNWINRKARLGILDVAMFFGNSGYTPQAILPHFALGLSAHMAQSGHMAGAVRVSYTAGLLPLDFDPESDSPYDVSPDFNCEPLLGLVRAKAALLVLEAVQDAVGAGGGSISMDGLSESFDAQRFAGRMQAMEARIDKRKDKALAEFGGNAVSFVK